MDEFDDKLKAFFSEFGTGRKMVLSTIENDKVSSRMMSIVQIDRIFYFQTDMTFRKYRQLMINHNAALCIDNIQIEGICKEIGKPLQNPFFCGVFRECFKNSYEAYSELNNERIFALEPLNIERWVYQGSIPYIEAFEIQTRKYSLVKYKGV